MRAKLREWVAVALVGLLPAIPLWLGGGLVNTRAGGDSPFLLIRVQQLVVSLRAGHFPVRWMPQAAYGLGFPFFNFYAALPYYLAAALKLLGFGYIAAIQLTQTIGFLLAAIALYGLCLELGHSRPASALAACVYSFAPFHMVNVYVRGDSLSEFYAFIFFPLILWALLRLRKQPGLRSVAWAALAYAGLLLSHNISWMIFTPFALLYALSPLFSRPAAGIKPAFRRVARGLLALAGGAMLGAWFWLPAVAERSSVYLRDMTTGYFNYAQHFRDLLGRPSAIPLVQLSLAFDWAVTGARQPFSMGLVQAVLAAAGVGAVCLRWLRQRRIEWQGAFAVVLFTGSTFMITPWSRPVWDHLPALPLTQFPWRFLSLQALAVSLLVPHLVLRHQRAHRFVAVLLGLVTIVSVLARLRPERLFIHEVDITDQRLMLYEYFTANVGTTIRHDYLPRWVDPRPYTSETFLRSAAAAAPGDDAGSKASPKPVPAVLQGSVLSSRLLGAGPVSERWEISVGPAGALVGFHTYYSPGWRALVDGQSARSEPLSGLGYVGLRLTPGRHEVALILERTAVQLLAELLSALSLAIVSAVLLLDRARSAAATRAANPSISRRLRNRAAFRVPVGVLATLALLAIFARVLPSREPDAQGLDLSMDFDRVPYLHHNPDGVRYGSAARLMRYELSTERVQAGGRLSLVSHWKDVRESGLTVKVELGTPAAYLFGVPPLLACETPLEEGASIESVLSIPADLMRGVYLLSVHVHGPEGEIRPLTQRGETLGTTYLVPIQVEGQTLSGKNAPTLQPFGERIALSSAQTLQRVAGTLDVTLIWNVLSPPTQNYKIALRLRDASGWEVARLDSQPGYGFYPTSMWRPGELVTDRYALPLDEGTPPGTHYALDVTLYESASLRPIGTARVPGVVLTEPTTSPAFAVLHAFGAAPTLSKAEIGKPEVEQGEELVLSLHWAATAAMDRNYQCRVTLRDGSGADVQTVTAPLSPEYPTSRWPPNAIVASRLRLRVAADTPPGQYSLALAVVDAASAAEAGEFVLPAPVRIIESPRDFTIPAMQTGVGADFDGQVRLLGYDLERDAKDLRVTLHWQALAAIPTDYKLFVHLFDPKTEKIAVQQDAPVGGETHPTSRWVPEEVVSDQIRLPMGNVAAGVYALGVGLYRPEGRLAVVVPGEFEISADRLLLIPRMRIP